MMKARTAKKDDLHKQVELRAYLIWESEGRPHGRAAEHWRQAEAEILGAKPAGRGKVAPKVKRASRTRKKAIQKD